MGAKNKDRGREDRLNSSPTPCEPYGQISRIRLKLANRKWKHGYTIATCRWATLLQSLDSLPHTTIQARRADTTSAGGKSHRCVTQSAPKARRVDTNRALETQPAAPCMQPRPHRPGSS